MSFSAMDSLLTGPLLAATEMRAVFSDEARIAAMIAVEAALAEAEAARQLVPAGLAVAIRRVEAADFDLARLGIATADAGVAAIPFVKALEAQLPEACRGHLHLGATSQDVLDTALALQIGQGLDLIASDLDAILAGLAVLARTHRRTPQIGRSLGQHAAPITFGAAVAVWLAGVAECAAELAPVRSRAAVASLGGPVGTLAGLGADGPAVAEHFAAILGLGYRSPCWHVARGRIAALGAWLTQLIGALAKIATDVVFLSATEVGEVSEAPAAGRGGSSAMPHKRNPVSATIILAAHGAAAGHLVTLMQAMAAGQQRPAGAWQSEWHALPALFGLASGALREARRIAETLVVHPARMRANIDLTGGLIFSDAVAGRLGPALGRAEARQIVEDAASAVHHGAASLASALLADKRIPSALGAGIAGAFDLAPAIAAGARATDRAIKDISPVRRQLQKKNGS